MLVGLIGYKRSGKDSVANILVERAGFTREAFANGVRVLAEAVNPYVAFTNDPEGTEPTEYARYLDVVARFGYDVAKQFPDVRRLLQRIGTEGGRQVFGEDVWVLATATRLGAITTGVPIPENVVITDVRFPNEGKFIEDFGGVLWRVNRPGTGADGDIHESEAHVANFEVDAEIDNSGTLDELVFNVGQAYHASGRTELHPMTVKGNRVENDLADASGVLTPSQASELVEALHGVDANLAVLDAPPALPATFETQADPGDESPAAVRQ